MEPGDFLKVIYFDEPFVSDFFTNYSGWGIKEN